MLDINRVLEIVKQKGLALPRDISKELGADTFITGAMLSQLKDKGSVRVSNTKIGGSPVYYLPGQEYRLETLYKYIHDKEKEAYNLLKEKKVLQDTRLDPVIRVALRNIKDFAKGLEVNLGDRKELFWKWFMTPNEEAEPIIKQILSSQEAAAPQPERHAAPAAEMPQQKREEDKKTQPALAHEEKSAAPAQAPEKEKPKPQTEEKPHKEEEKREEQKTLDKRHDELPQEKHHTVHKESEPDGPDPFYAKLQKYFEKNNVEVLSRELLKKNGEYDLQIRLPSAAGLLNYYCKAKNKKRITDADLSTAYVKGEFSKLPILFITTGELTRRAKEMLLKEFRNINVIYV